MDNPVLNVYRDRRIIGGGTRLRVAVEDDVLVSPEQVAELFCCMTDDEQAAFFNHIAVSLGRKLLMQLQYITDHEDLTPQGRSVMRTIGEFADPSE